MTITLYTITSCPYSQQEKEYLRGKSVVFTEVVLDQQKDKLAEFKTVGSGFSGVPLTVVVHDDGSQVIVKGFDLVLLDQALGIGKPVDTQAQPVTADANTTPVPGMGVTQPTSTPPPEPVDGSDAPKVQAPIPNETSQPQEAPVAATEVSSSPDMASIPPVSSTESPQPPQNDGSVT